MPIPSTVQRAAPPPPRPSPTFGGGGRCPGCPLSRDSGGGSGWGWSLSGAAWRHRTGAALLSAGALALAALAPPPAARADTADGLSDRPVLVVDPGFHTAPIARADVDAAGRFAVTGSLDKTVRLWSLADGALLRTFRLPLGPDNVGKAVAVAISPDGAVIAAGGWTNGPGFGGPVYLFDRDGRLTARIPGLPSIVSHLAFSPDGRFLAVAVGGTNGLRVHDREKGWAEAARDPDYGYDCYGAAFASDGRLATTSYDGKVRLYDRAFQRVATWAATGGHRPFGLAFSPDGSRLAVGYTDSRAVDLLDGRTLSVAGAPDTNGLDNGDIGTIAWSVDGQTLFAAGGYDNGKGDPVVTWTEGGRGARRPIPAAANTVMSLAPLPDGDLLMAAQDPLLARLAPDGTARWRHGPARVDFRDQRSTLAVSADGALVDFGYEVWGKAPSRFDLRAPGPHLDPSADHRTQPPKQVGLAIAHWVNDEHPTLDGQPLALDQYERSRSLAVHPAGNRFVLGTEWWLRAYDRAGKELWRRDVPGAVWAVNISGDGRLVVAAYGDGTIRWHRMEDGRELLAVMPLKDAERNWVAWMPEGFWAASPGAKGMLRWHINHGFDRAPETVPVSRFPGLERPDLLAAAIGKGGLERALKPGDLARARELLEKGFGVAPGPRLRLLAVGIDDYGDKAKSLHLDYAAKDAKTVAEKILAAENSFYTKVTLQYLHDADATREGIFSALQTLRNGEDDDLTVVMFSGHGRTIDGNLYLMPYGVNMAADYTIKSSAFNVGELANELSLLSKKGKVVVLLDACYSGAGTGGGAGKGLNADQLREALGKANITVLTSSQAGEISREDPKWGHGAFSKALLEAFSDPKADTDHNGQLSVSELARYLEKRVPELTGGAQHPALEKRFDTDVFPSGG